MADQYAKSWCSKFDDPWYLSLTCLERGLFDQLCTWAKRSGDTGEINLRNFPAVASLFALDVKTARKCLGKFRAVQKVDFLETKEGISITILNYEKNQRLRKARDSRKQGNTQDKSSLNQTRPEKTKPDQIEETTKKQLTSDEGKNPGKIPDAATQYKSFIDDHWPEFEELLKMLHYHELCPAGVDTEGQINYLSESVIQGELLAYIQTNSEKVLKVLSGSDGGSWLNYTRRWLQKSLKGVRAGGTGPNLYKTPMTREEEDKMRREKGERVIYDKP